MASDDRARDLAVARQFGALVRQARVEAGLTQETLAERAELHPTFVSNLERGYRVPTLVTVLRVASALEVDAANLIDGIEI